MESRVRAFLEEIATWAGEQTDVRGIVLVGSQARMDTPADEVSDVDLGLFVDQPARYLTDETWTQRFGEPLLTILEPTAVGGFEERRVLFRDGLEVDFAVLPTNVAKTRPPELEAVLARGFRVLYDDGIGLDARVPPRIEPPEPTQGELDQLANDFWYHLLWSAKKLRRGEVLLAKQACDCFLTAKLAELARWRAHGRDTWHGLRFFERWAEPELVEAMRPTFARYEPEDVARALRVTGELFRRLEDDVAQRFGLTAPVDPDEIFRRLDMLVMR